MPFDSFNFNYYCTKDNFFQNQNETTQSPLIFSIIETWTLKLVDFEVFGNFEIDKNNIKSISSG